VLLNHFVDSHVAGYVRKPDVDELGYVQCAMVVPARRDGRGENDCRSVNGLEDALEMTLPDNLLDEHWCETPGAEFLVHTEIVSLDYTQFSEKVISNDEV
jgi:hypothetical protein